MNSNQDGSYGPLFQDGSYGPLGTVSRPTFFEFCFSYSDPLGTVSRPTFFEFCFSYSDPLGTVSRLTFFEFCFSKCYTCFFLFTASFFATICLIKKKTYGPGGTPY